MGEPLLAPITLGHNAFFGVDHLSAARGAERASQFSDPARILAMVSHAYDLGARGMMLSTHERAAPLGKMIQSDKKLAADLRVYPLLPYINKYVTRANEVGMINVVFDALSGGSWTDKLGMIWQGGRAILGKDVFAILSALIRLELKPFRALTVPAVFLHDALTDLALALGLKDVFEFYHDEMARSHRTQAAFATKNLPLFLERFKEWNLPAPVVMTHFNKTGFHMNPSREACERASQNHQASIMAMGSLASGFLRPDEAYAYLAGIPNIDSVVVGVSSPAHAEETFEAIRRHRVIRSMRTSPTPATSAGS